MKVFINRPTGGYIDGLIVIAANSPMESHGAMCTEDESLTYWYEASGWQELAGVTADTARYAPSSTRKIPSKIHLHVNES